MRGKNAIFPNLALTLLLSGCVTTNQLWDHGVTVKSQDNTAAPGGFPVYTVPANKQLVLTDVVMTHNVNTTTGTFRANIRRGPASNASACQTAGLVLGPYVRPSETIALDLTTGILFKSGDQLCIAIGGAGAPTEGVTFGFSGYMVNN